MNIKGLFLYFSTLMLRICLATMTHAKCRGGLYPRSTAERFPVPDDKVSWLTEFPSYDPQKYTAPEVFGKSWADPEIDDPDFEPKWNELDNNVNRKSHTGIYPVMDNFPLNPIGRTGICGRGLLGRWGPNHAADPIVTRWKKVKGNPNKIPILQFVAIKRRDTGEWALPGGMVDSGEIAATAAIREFQEEAINSLDKTEDENHSWWLQFQKFFAVGEEVYKGYVDDPRNTDNAWLETVAYNYHDDTGEIVGAINLNAGDDATKVRWVDYTPGIQLYASHNDLVEEVLRRRLAALHSE